ncbi:MAG: TetR/AcrR family transcriptional regulator, partial [Lysobacterales bacterium]
GRKTRDRLLQAAEAEFGEHGYYETAISGITQRAGVALGTFYTYFDSKEAIFEGLVRYMSERTRRWVGERVAGASNRLEAERLGLEAYIEFVRQHKGLYRIITEAEFVANEAFRDHYEGFARGYVYNLSSAGKRGEIRQGDYEVWSWAIIGINVFLGMRYADWDQNVPSSHIAETVLDLLANGLQPGKEPDT